MSGVKEFMELIEGGDPDASSFRHATIPPDYVSGRPRLVFDGEVTAGDRLYPTLGDYVPAAGDRVLVAMTGKTGGGVVLGKIN